MLIVEYTAPTLHVIFHTTLFSNEGPFLHNEYNTGDLFHPSISPSKKLIRAKMVRISIIDLY